jgi:hypothetical protein
MLFRAFSQVKKQRKQVLQSWPATARNILAMIGDLVSVLRIHEMLSLKHLTPSCADVRVKSTLEDRSSLSRLSIPRGSFELKASSAT